MQNIKMYSDAVIEGISVPVGTPDSDVLLKAKQKMKRSGIRTEALHFRIYKNSVDARRRNDIRLVYSVLCSVIGGERALREDMLARAGIRPLTVEKVDLSPVREAGDIPCRLASRPLVGGMGPAGLFCAYILAQNGYAPVIIDRGDGVDERVAAVEKFVADGALDSESNVQFGAGGAGTFSDGKLLTRISDARCNYVMETLCRMGAPEDILLKAKPHVGTDILRVVVKNMLDEIERLGGSVCYRTRLEDLSRTAAGGFIAKTNKGDISAGALVLAIGNGARDTFKMLLEKDLLIEPKPISVGVRIEHRREDIDSMLYGKLAGHPDLGAAEYNLSDTRGERGVYTF